MHTTHYDALCSVHSAHCKLHSAPCTQAHCTVHPAHYTLRTLPLLGPAESRLQAGLMAVVRDFTHSIQICGTAPEDTAVAMPSPPSGKQRPMVQSPFLEPPTHKSCLTLRTTLTLGAGISVALVGILGVGVLFWQATTSVSPLAQVLRQQVHGNAADSIQRFLALMHNDLRAIHTRWEIEGVPSPHDVPRIAQQGYSIMSNVPDWYPGLAVVQVKGGILQGW